MTEITTGYIHIYTGNGKGKTTAALGVALRALGQGLTVALLQFMKGRQNYGELIALRRFSNCLIEQYGRDEFVDPRQPDSRDIELAQRGWQRAQALVATENFNLVILDELNLAAAWNLVKAEEVLDLMRNKPPALELILTGRNAPEAFIAAADLVTEMRALKHYFETQGVTGRAGIEY